MELNRKPTKQEERLIQVLLQKSTTTLSDNWEKDLLVRNMNDGEMGSLYLFPQGNLAEERVFGCQVADMQYTDIDGIEVIVSLYLDESGNLFELDVWKTNYGKLLSLPDLL